MELEVFVRAAGVAMGLVRDSFGVDVGEGAAPVATPRLSPTLAAAVSGSGQAVSAFNNTSKLVDGQVTALGEQDQVANSDLASALAVAGAGRDQMDAVIAAALGDLNRLAAATATPAGQQALVNALALRLEQTWQALTNGSADASTRSANSARVAAAYSGLGGYPGAGVAPTVPMSSMAAMSPLAATVPISSTAAMSPMDAMSPMQSMPMLAAGTMAANQAALSAAEQMASMQQQSASNSGGQHPTLTSATTTDSSQINTVVNRAMKELGVPYVWGGGGPNGPTNGGFDCSGLVQYAYWPYVHLPRDTYGQINVGRTVSPSDIQAGDLIFSYFGEGGNPGPGHVQLAISHTQVVEAPYTGADVRVSGIAPGHIVVKRILG